MIISLTFRNAYRNSSDIVFIEMVYLNKLSNNNRNQFETRTPLSYLTTTKFALHIFKNDYFLREYFS